MSFELLVWAVLFALSGVLASLLLFLFMQILHAYLGPWRRLVKAYPASGHFVGRRWPLRWILLRPRALYRAVVTVGVGPAGLYLAGMVPMIARRAILIPWSDLTVEPVHGRLLLATEGVPTARIQLGGGLLMEVINEAGGAWPAGAALVEEPVYE